MRKMMVSGFLVADAEKGVSTNGTPYMTFRIGNNDYSNKKDENGRPVTYWFRITSYNPEHINLSKYLVKGKPVTVIGNYTDDIYQSRTTGNCEISRDIKAQSIDFMISDSNNKSSSTTKQNTNDVPKVTNDGKSFNVEKDTIKLQSEIESESNAGFNEEDLPF